MAIHIACVVEGHGDVPALPILVRRIAAQVLPGELLVIPDSIRIPRSKLLKPGELERAIELAALKAGANGGILVSLDADDDCPATLGPQLLARAQQARDDMSIAVVLPVREFEAWFIGRMEDVAGYKGIPVGTTSHPAPETIRGAKGWLSQHMTEVRYSATIDQPALARRIDINEARYMASFDKLCRDVEHLLAALTVGD